MDGLTDGWMDCCSYRRDEIKQQEIKLMETVSKFWAHGQKLKLTF
jgi:hypothetical protein